MRYRYLLLIAAAVVPWAARAQDAGISRLGVQLHSADPGLRRQAAVALGRVSLAQSVQLLRRARQEEPNTAIRFEIVRALRNIVFMRYPGYPDAVAALGEACDPRLEADELVRLRALEAMWETAARDLLEPTTYLTRGLADPSQRLRLASVAMLRKYAAPTAVLPLGTAALDHGQPEAVRKAAIAALGAVPLVDPGPAGEATLRANQRVAEALGTQPIADSALLQHRQANQVSYLARLLRDPETEPQLALAAVRALGQVKHRSAIPILEEVARGYRNDAVRKQASRALSHVLARQYE
jgi:hypothetical protein